MLSPFFASTTPGAARLAAALLALALLAGPAAAAASPAPAVSPAASSQPAVTIAFLGDSLTAGYGLGDQQAFPFLIGKALEAEGRQVLVVNAGISGDTTAGGLARLDWLLRNKPDIVVVSLGANDGLRGLPLASSEKNLRAIAEKAKAFGAKVLLVGMMIPPNYGPDYTRQFAEIYPRVAAELEVPLVPFLLDGVAGIRELNQADGIHPTAKGQEILARTLLGPVRKLVDEVEKSRKAP